MDHAKALLESSTLSKNENLLVQILNLIKDQEFVLIGGHAIGGYTGRPRATKDVDIVSNDYKSIAQIIKDNFSDVEVNKDGDSIRITNDGEELVDIIIPKGDNKFYNQVMHNNVAVTIDGIQVHIPDLEAILASKFASIVSPHRPQADKYIDAGDLIRMVKNNRDDIDYQKLKRMANHIYQGGGEEIEDMIADILEGRSIQI